MTVFFRGFNHREGVIDYELTKISEENGVNQAWM